MKKLTRRGFLAGAGATGIVLATAKFGIAAAQNRTLKSGVWSDPTVWELGVPDSTHKVVIRHVVTLDTGGQANTITINAGRTLTFDPNTSLTLQSKGNVTVEGTLNMVPASSSVIHILRFTGSQESQFVGGGDIPLATDVGLWVPNVGVLNLQGTVKTAWNRTGDDPSWSGSDELVVTPVAYGASVQDETPFSTFTKGGSVPAVTFAAGTPEERTYFAEVLNLTRNVRVEGKDNTHRAHIWISSTGAQTLRHVAIRYMGPRQAGGNGTISVLGRYGLHFHKCMASQSGRTFEGLVVRDTGGHAFVAHMSDGILFKDCISYNTFDAAYWWDFAVDNYPSPPSPVTNNVTYDGCVAALVRSDPVYEGYRLAGFSLTGSGVGNKRINCVSVGVQGNSDSAGAVWEETPPWVDLAGMQDQGLWVFEGNVDHNNSGFGSTVWQVNGGDHVITGYDAYHNGKGGVLNGAYGNPYKWHDMRLYSNGGSNDNTDLGPHTQFFMWAGSVNTQHTPTGAPWDIVDSVLHAGGRTASALILPGRAVISLKDNQNADDDPGLVSNTVFRGYNSEAVLVTFSFHDFGPYKTQWTLQGNDFGATDIVFDDTDGGAGPPGIHNDTTVILAGVGTLHPSTWGTGTFDAARNCWIT